MLQPHPESPFSQQSIDRLHRRDTLRTASHLAMTALLGVTPFVSVYAQDVYQNMEVQANAKIDVERLYEPLDPDNSNVAIVALHGFGNYDSKEVAKYLGPAAQIFQDGQRWSVKYGNAFLEEQAITEKIIELSKAYNVDTISLLGYSGGGAISMRVAEQLMRQADLDVSLIIATSTPDGAKGLRQLQRDEIEVSQAIELIPGAKYSSFVRYIGEMYFRRDQYDSGSPIEQLSDAFTVHQSVLEDLQKKDMPGTWLLTDQVNAITSAHIEDRIESMATMEGETPPVVVYLGTAEPGYDYVVNDKLSGSNICGYAHEHDMTCIRYNVPGAVHTRPDLANDAYLQTAEAIGPMVRHALLQRTETTMLNADEPATTISILPPDVR